MIDIRELNDTHIGREVRYISSGGDKIEFGKITSWNDRFIFVRYHTQIKPNRLSFTGETSAATGPEDLTFTV